jgi:hypothetical protein
MPEWFKDLLGTAVVAAIVCWCLWRVWKMRDE